ncbi:hypothetical protein Tco_0642805 [Tanacetum coccineum]
MQAAQDRQKSYADRKRKPMEFEVGDRVMLKVSPWKGVVRFGKRGKLNPRYVRPFKVLAKVWKVSYRLELPQELSSVHHTFHFVEEPVEIMEREIKRLKRSRIPLVKVRWNSRRGPKFTWEREDSFKQKYPQLFTNRASSSTTREYQLVYTDSEPGPVGGFWGADDEERPRESTGGQPPVPQDEHEFLAVEQHLPPIDSPTTESPGYVTESDLEEDPEEDDANDEDEDEEDEEEEEHLAPADSTVIPADEPVFPPEGTEPGAPLLRDDIPESEQHPRKEVCIFFTSRLNMRSEESSTADLPGGIRDTWVDRRKASPDDSTLSVGMSSTLEVGILLSRRHLWMVERRPNASPRGCSFDRIESGDLIRASEPSRSCVMNMRGPISRHTRHNYSRRWALESSDGMRRGDGADMADLSCWHCEVA